MACGNSFLGTWKLCDQPGYQSALAHDVELKFNPDFTYEITLWKDNGKCIFSGTYEIHEDQIRMYANGDLELESLTYDGLKDVLMVYPGAIFERRI